MKLQYTCIYRLLLGVNISVITCLDILAYLDRTLDLILRVDSGLVYLPGYEVNCILHVLILQV